MALPLDAVDDLFAARFATGLTPGMVYGVIADGRLHHTGTFGLTRVAEEHPIAPGADSVFRIASMSKSFTAAALLLMRERALIDLDEAVAQYVPELVDQPPYSADSPAVTLRHLLTMGAGLLSDDPWGDRQESLTYEEFGTFLDGGITVGSAPGVRYEYSNLGYALLGRVIENVLGGEHPEGAHRDFVERDLLAPLGMTRTRFDAAEVGPALVPGHVLRLTGWEELAPTRPGAFSAMGGLHSSVSDLARWVTGFLDAFRPGRDTHPLSKASRRAMQQMHRFAQVEARLETAGTPALGASATGYGYGLQVEHDAELGQFVHHSGGYPGYGSRMVWHPDTGYGVVTLSNATYAGAQEQAVEAVRLLVRADGRLSRTPALTATDEAVEYATEHLVAEPQRPDGVPFADPDHFAENVELDQPDPERTAFLAAFRSLIGPARTGERPPQVWSRTMAQAGWSLPAEGGRYDLETMLSPEERPRLQRLTVQMVPAAPAVLRRAAQEALLADTAQARLLRGFGEPELVREPVSCDGSGRAEFLVAAGRTWWKAEVSSSGGPAAESGEAADEPAGFSVTLSAHPTSRYPRLAQLARYSDRIAIPPTTE